MSNSNKPSPVNANTPILDNETIPIHKTHCSIHQRMGFLPQYLGNAHIQFQNRIYFFAQHFIAGYDGGYWEFYHLSNGGLMMEWDNCDNITVNSPNGSSAEVDAETASIVINLIALSDLSFALQANSNSLSQVVNGFHSLHEFALQHPHSTTILKLID